MSDQNGHRGRDVTIFAPPAAAHGLAPLPGSSVPTPGRLAAPVAQIAIPVPFDRLVGLIRVLREFFGEAFEFTPNAEVASRLSSRDWMDLQEVLRKDVPTT